MSTCGSFTEAVQSVCQDCRWLLLSWRRLLSVWMSHLQQTCMFVHIVPCNPAHMQCADSNLGFGTEWDASAFGVCMLVMSVFWGIWCLGVYLHIRQMMSWVCRKLHHEERHRLYFSQDIRVNTSRRTMYYKLSIRINNTFSFKSRYIHNMFRSYWTIIKC
jgi:hypothetical protein